MENKHLNVSLTLAWVLTLAAILAGIGIILSDSAYLLYFGIALGFSSWIIILSDMIIMPIYNRPLWILSMIFLTLIAQVIYLVMRKKLISLQDKFDKK